MSFNSCCDDAMMCNDESHDDDSLYAEVEKGEVTSLLENGGILDPVLMVGTCVHPQVGTGGTDDVNTVILMLCQPFH